MLVEESNHEFIVALRDTNQLALWRPCTQVDLNGHRAGMKTLAKVAAGALDALAAGVAKAHSLLLDSGSKGHVIRS
tara:strand:- start:539 stop:766 length:228 start_codon:yes stop_codon:yes gene_type:complete